MLTSLDQVGLLADFFSSFAHEVLDRNQPAPDTQPRELFMSLPGDVLHSFSTALQQTIQNSRNPIHTFQEKYQEAQPMREPAELRVVSALPADNSSGLAPSTVNVTFARRFMGLNTEDIGMTIQQLLRQLLVTLNTLLKMPDTIEGILTRLETGQFVINLGGDIGVGATAFRRRKRDDSQAAFPLALAGMFVASVGGAFLFDSIHDPLLAIVSLILAAILGIRLFFRW